MTQKLTLYHNEYSTHSRGALMTIRNLGLEVDIKPLNLIEKEQLNPDFIKINPQHCVPTLIDNDFVLWESRPIAIYLIDSKVEAGSDASRLYPTDVKQRAIVNQRLQFDAGTLYKRIRAICFPIIYLGVTSIPDDKRKELNEAFEILNLFLHGQKYVAGGDNFTIADIFTISSILSVVKAGADLSGYENITAWFERCKLLPGFEENERGATLFGERIKTNLIDSKF